MAEVYTKIAIHVLLSELVGNWSLLKQSCYRCAKNDIHRSISCERSPIQRPVFHLHHIEQKIPLLLIDCRIVFILSATNGRSPAITRRHVIGKEYTCMLTSIMGFIFQQWVSSHFHAFNRAGKTSFKMAVWFLLKHIDAARLMQKYL